MSQLSTSRAALIFLSTTLALAGAACSSDKLSTNDLRNAQPVATRDSTLAVPASPVPESAKSNSNQPNFYELALDKAYSALSISQSAESTDDWKVVVSQWREAIALLKAVPATSPYKALAQTKIPEYRRSLLYAQHQATRPFRNDLDSIVAVIPPPPVQVITSSDPAQEASPLLPSQPVFQAKIKRRAGGTPVIDVTFNGTQEFEMIVDTGASGTVLTQQAAAALGVVPLAKAKANTASGTSVEFPLGHVNSIEVGGAVVKDVAVAIAPSPELETGLLGHDFFGNYDVTIKRDLVEFRPR